MMPYGISEVGHSPPSITECSGISEPPPEIAMLRSTPVPNWDAGSPEKMQTVLSLFALFHRVATEMLSSCFSLTGD